MVSDDVCEDYCLFDLYDRCVDNQQCNSFSYDIQNQGQLYSGLQYQNSPKNFIMIRRDIYDNFTEITTTSTTTVTTTTSSTGTSTTATTTTVTNTTFTSTTVTTSTVTTSSATLTSSTLSSSTLTSSTETDTTITVSSTSVTDTSSTMSNTSQTVTTTSSTSQTLKDSLTSGSGNENNNDNVKPATQGSKKSREHIVISILVSLFIVIILGFGIIGYFIYKKRNTIVNAPQINREILGFDNPVYNQNYQDRGQNTENQEVLYQDTDGYDPDADYLEIDQ